jgi:CBS domain containing-hemolysin-like protein
MIPILAAAPIVPGDGEVTGTVSGIIFYIVLALGISGLCSLLEAVLLTSSVSQVEMLAQEDKPAGLLMRKHKQNIEQAIAAILTLNTIAHTVGAAGAGAQAAGVFGNQWVGWISMVITLLILVLSEILPKTLGAVYWKDLLPFTAYTIQGFIWLTYPAVWLFQRLTDLITPKGDQPSITRSELEIMAQISTGEGALEEREKRILKNLLHLDRVQVGAVMTPRMVMFALSQEMTVGEMVKQHPALAHSRIPIYDRSVDDCESFVLRYDVLKAAAEDRDSMQLKELARPMSSVPEVLPVAKVMDEFFTRQQHILLVFDEHGGIAGIITMEDAIESLFGLEITDESDVVSDLRQLAKQRYTRKSQMQTLGEAKDGALSDDTGERKTVGEGESAP